VYIAISFLSSEKQSLIPELLSILKDHQIVQLVQMYGGETIKIPTAEEFSDNLLSAMGAYHVHVQGGTWEAFAKIHGLKRNQMRRYKTKVNHWLRSQTDDELEFLSKMSSIIQYKQKNKG